MQSNNSSVQQLSKLGSNNQSTQSLLLKQEIQQNLNFDIEQFEFGSQETILLSEIKDMYPSIQNQTQVQHQNQAQKYIQLHSLGAGGQGSVSLVLDKKNNLRYAEKSFNSQDIYQKEKCIMLKIKHDISEASNLIGKMVWHDEDNLKLYLEQGYCNLQEYCVERAKRHIYWFDRQYELSFLCKTLFAILIKLYLKGIFHGDFKPHNIILYKVNFLPQLNLKLIDFGIAEDQWSQISGKTPKYFVERSEFKDQIDRLKAEIFCLGRILQEVAMTSICAKENEMNLFDYYMKNQPYCIELCLKKISIYYNNDMYQIIRMMLEEYEPVLVYNKVQKLEQQKYIQDIGKLATQIDFRKMQSQISRNYQNNDENNNDDSQYKSNNFTELEDERTKIPEELKEVQQLMKIQEHRSSVQDIIADLQECKEFEMFERGLAIIEQYDKNDFIYKHPQFVYFKLCFLNIKGDENERKLFLEQLTQKELAIKLNNHSVYMDIQEEKILFQKDVKAIEAFLQEQIQINSENSLQVVRAYKILAIYYYQEYVNLKIQFKKSKNKQLEIKVQQCILQSLNMFYRSITLIENMNPQNHFQNYEDVVTQFEEYQILEQQQKEQSQNSIDKELQQKNKYGKELEQIKEIDEEKEDYFQEIEVQRQISESNYLNNNENKSEEEIKQDQEIKNLKDEVQKIQLFLKILISQQISKQNQNNQQIKDIETQDIIDIETAQILKHLIKILKPGDKLLLYERQKDILDKVYKRERFHKNNRLYAQLLHNIGVCYNQKEQYKKSLQLKLESQEIKRVIDGENTISYSTGMLNIGLNYWTLYQYLKAFKFILEAALIFKQLQNAEQYQKTIIKLAQLIEFNLDYKQLSKQEKYSKLLQITQLKSDSLTYSFHKQNQNNNQEKKLELNAEDQQHQQHQQFNNELISYGEGTDTNKKEANKKLTDKQLQNIDKYIQKYLIEPAKLLQKYQCFEQCISLYEIASDIYSKKNISKENLNIEMQRINYIKFAYEDYYKKDYEDALNNYNNAIELQQQKYLSAQDHIFWLINQAQIYNDHLNNQQKSIYLKRNALILAKQQNDPVLQADILLILKEDEKNIQECIDLTENEANLKLQNYLSHKILAEEFLEKQKQEAKSNKLTFIKQQLIHIELSLGKDHEKYFVTCLEKTLFLPDNKCFESLDTFKTIFQKAEIYQLSQVRVQAQVYFIDVVWNWTVESQIEYKNDIIFITNHYFKEENMKLSFEKVLKLSNIHENIQNYFFSEKILKQFKNSDQVKNLLHKMLDLKKKKLLDLHEQYKSNSANFSPNKSQFI